MDRKLLLRYAFRESLGLLVMGVALFWSAGRLDWWGAWATLAVMLAWTTATAIVILRANPALLVERLGPRKGAKAWDSVIMSSLGVLQLVRYIIAGLDQRYGWTGGFPVGTQGAALLICAAGYALFVWATASNAFFSQIVRVQFERDHCVVSDGPYQYVRHPGYAGAILFELAVPFLLGSWWAFLISVVTTALLILRTMLEDHTLIKELPGYADYSRRVRYRLLPGTW
jgi:protein-S-isoprenylcysteine O-methyltransferase Ste14